MIYIAETDDMEGPANVWFRPLGVAVCMCSCAYQTIFIYCQKCRFKFKEFFRSIKARHNQKSIPLVRDSGATCWQNQIVGQKEDWVSWPLCE